jgi:hypothetical protein
MIRRARGGRDGRLLRRRREGKRRGQKWKSAAVEMVVRVRSKRVTLPELRLEGSVKGQGGMSEREERRTIGSGVEGQSKRSWKGAKRKRLQWFERHRSESGEAR